MGVAEVAAAAVVVVEDDDAEEHPATSDAAPMTVATTAGNRSLFGIISLPRWRTSDSSPATTVRGAVRMVNGRLVACPCARRVAHAVSRLGLPPASSRGQQSGPSGLDVCGLDLFGFKEWPAVTVWRQ